jgi:hypothetical protein
LLWLLHAAESVLGIFDETFTERPSIPKVKTSRRA